MDPEASAAMEPMFAQLREEMLRFALRPSASTHARMCEAYVVLGDTDLALGALDSLQVWKEALQHGRAGPPAEARQAFG